MSDLATNVRKGTPLASTSARNAFGRRLGAAPFDLFRNFYSPESLGLGFAADGIDISRNESGYTVEIPVAGYKPDQIEVTIKDAVFSVSGKSDRRSFTRSLALPPDVDADNVEARIENGLLTLALHHVPEARPKRISIT